MRRMVRHISNGPMSKEGTSVGSDYWQEFPDGTHLLWDRSGSSELFKTSNADFARRSWHGFCFDGRPRRLEVAMPASSLAILSAVLMAISFLALQRRLAQGCHRCSYDLTGNTSGVCPECGTKIASDVGALT